MKTHFGDPCIHCHIPHDDVPIGECQGDFHKSKRIAVAFLETRWDNVVHFRCRWSDGRIEDEWANVDAINWLYMNDLPYDSTLKVPR
jgi:hypothetical protein